MEQTLIDLEQKFGGYCNGITRRKVSASDPRPASVIKKGGMIGGDRMSPDHHGYAATYARHLKGKISRRVVVVEVGILKGTGLAIWSEIFTAESRIIGLDIDLTHLAENRDRLDEIGAFHKNNFEFYEFDQFADNAALMDFILKGEKIDIVIDDGCHFDDAIINTMRCLWPHLADEFVYFVEDNKRFARIFKDKMLKQARLDFPRLAFYSDGAITTIKDGSLADWIGKYISHKPDFKNPRSFNEKINWKKLHDRNPLLTVTADKYAVRKYVTDKLGTAAFLKPILFVGDNPADIPFDDLPKNYVVKANHGSGWFIFVRGDEDRGAIITTCRKWLAERYAPHALEWCYDGIHPQIIIEALIEKTPDSYKLHIFHGKCELIQLSAGSIERKKSLTFTMYDMDWNKLDVRYVHPPGDAIPRPAFLDSLIKYSETIGNDFDYVRVDWCIGPGGEIYFEEITHYPVSGHANIKPPEFDFELGEKWQVEPYYWLKK